MSTFRMTKVGWEFDPSGLVVERPLSRIGRQRVMHADCPVCGAKRGAVKYERRPWFMESGHAKEHPHEWNQDDDDVLRRVSKWPAVAEALIRERAFLTTAEAVRNHRKRADVSPR